MAEALGHPDSFIDEQEPKSSKVVWDALCDAERDIKPYWDFCDRIDRLIGASGDLATGRGFYYTDQEFDLFWASLEILKPAVYAKPPVPVVTPRFADRDKVATTASELLERCLVSSFERGDFDQVMLNARDDLIIAGRGVTRVTYEDDEEGGKRICDEHVDRCDFLHEPARKWSEVGWVAFAGYLTERQFKKRFPKAPAENAQFNIRRDTNERDRTDTFAKCKVWEVWHRADKRVYWVTEGVETFLDEKKPFLPLEGFYPCPRPAYGTLKRRTLIPVPDYVRYEKHLDQINTLTARIYNLLEFVKVRGLIAAGGDVGKAVEMALDQQGDDVWLVAVPGAALMAGSGAANFVQFLPLDVFATAIKGLLEARREMINNFYELSGISDIMRGATEAEETLGAQQLKSQYGSVRVKEKIDELQRLARDVARISAEIIAEKFDQDTLLEMAQMKLPARADLKKNLKELEDAAKKEMGNLEKQAAEKVQQAQQQGQQIDPQQAEQQFQQAQGQIVQKYQQQIKEIADTVSIDDVMELLRDQKARAFTIEIETDSTIMVDEIAEKQSRAQFLEAFSRASGAVQPLLMAGEPGAKLAGGLLKFALGPYRAGRELDGMIDDFIEAAPEILAQQQGQGDVEKQIAEANVKIAEAEYRKAEAAIMKVQADTQAKDQETRLKAADAAAKAEADQQRIGLELQQTQGSIAETGARIQKIEADIQLAFAKLGLEQQREERESIKTAADLEMRATDQAMDAQDRERDAAFRAHDAQRADRQQDFTERSGERQQTFAERQAEREPV